MAGPPTSAALLLFFFLLPLDSSHGGAAVALRSPPGKRAPRTRRLASPPPLPFVAAAAAPNISINASVNASVDVVSAGFSILPPPPLPPPIASNKTIDTPRSRRAAKRAKDRQMIKEILEEHNKVRAVEKEPFYSWNKKLARYARDWTRTLRENCTMNHTINGEYGENMFWGKGYGWRAWQAVDYWVKEEVHYNRLNNTCAFNETCGHYMQIAWNSSAAPTVGCALVDCFRPGVLVACWYDPPGNYIGESPFQPYE